jgi:tetratricopeptide (TPR) repeat protein
MEKNSEDHPRDPHTLKDFFISYAVEDRIQATWIHQQLEDHGYRTILAGRDFFAGNNFVLEMDHALQISARMIAIISPDYLASPYTRAEWAAVFRRDPTGAQGLLLPVLVRSCEVEGLLAPLLRINLIDLIGKDDQQAQKRLLRGVRQSPRSRSLVSSLAGEEVSLPSSRIWHIPFPRNPLFTGREDLLDQLHQKLTTPPTSDATTTIAALTQPQALKGLGGIGKTQLAVEYAYRYQDHYPHTFWVNAATMETLIGSFVAIADLLPSFPAKNEQDQNKVVEAVKQWLEHCDTRWLLIFDNADNISLVRPFLPKSGPGHILLTTRAHAVSSLAASIEVKKMSLMEGTCLLLRRVYGLAPHLSPMQVLEYTSIEDTNEAGNIVAALDSLPLALDQAGAYIEETGCGFAEYLNVYNTHHKTLLARRGIQATNYPNSVATTWLLSFQKVQQTNPAAAELLCLCAFLAPDQIPEELIRDGAAHWNFPLQQATADLLTFNQMIEDLLKFSLVKRLAKPHMLSIHRLIQVVLIDTLTIDKQWQWVVGVIQAVNNVFPKDVNDTSMWSQCQRYLSQVQACYTLIEQYFMPMQQSTLWLIEAAILLDRTGLYLWHRALYSIAESLYQRALIIYEQRLGPEHPYIARSLNNLAGLYESQDQYDQAEPLFQRALAIHEQQLGPEHLDTALSLNNLAFLYINQGQYDQASPLLQRALAIYEQQLGPDHSDVALGLNNLAGIYESQGQHAMAEPLLQRALKIREQQLGQEHPDTALSLNNLAFLYINQGQYDQASPLLQRALEIRKQQLGQEHPDTALSLNNLAFLYINQGQYDQAKPLLQRALTIFTQVLGSGHSQTKETYERLQVVVEALDKAEKVTPLATEQQKQARIEKE